MDPKVDLDVPVAAWNVLRGDCFPLLLLQAVASQWAGIFPRDTELLDGDVVQIDLVRLDTFAQVEGAKLVRFRWGEDTAGAHQQPIVTGSILSRERKPTRPGAAWRLVGVAGPVGEDLRLERPIRDVHRGHLDYLRLLGQIRRAEKPLADRLAETLPRGRLIHFERNDILGVEGPVWFLLGQLFGTTKRTTQGARFGRVAHRGAATLAVEVVGRDGSFCGSVRLASVGRLGTALRAKEILLIQHPTADGAFFE